MKHFIAKQILMFWGFLVILGIGCPLECNATATIAAYNAGDSLWINPITAKPGDTITAPIYLSNHTDLSVAIFGIYAPEGGIKFIPLKETASKKTWISSVGRSSQYADDGVTVDWAMTPRSMKDADGNTIFDENGDSIVNTLSIIGTNGYNENVWTVDTTGSPIAKVRLIIPKNISSGKYVGEVKNNRPNKYGSNLIDFANKKGETIYIINTKFAINVVAPATDASLTEIVENGKDGTLYNMTGEVTSVYKNGNDIYCTDGTNWLELQGETGNMIAGSKLANVQGTLSGKDTNPVLTLTSSPTVTEPTTPWTWDNVKTLDLVKHYIGELNVAGNSIYRVKGYYTADATQLRQYPNAFYPGQYIDIDWSYYDGTKPSEGQLVNTISVFKLKEAWTKASKIAKADNGAHTNYIIMPFSAEISTVTGVDNIENAKNVTSVKYYNLAGQEINADCEGANVVVTTYTDGSKQVEKTWK